MLSVSKNTKLFDTMMEADFTVSALSRASGVARNTIDKMLESQAVMPLQAHKVARALSRKLGRPITVEDLQIPMIGF